MSRQDQLDGGPSRGCSRREVAAAPAQRLGVRHAGSRTHPATNPHWLPMPARTRMRVSARAAQRTCSSPRARARFGDPQVLCPVLPPPWSPSSADRVDEPLDVVGLGRDFARGISCRWRQRLSGLLGGLRLGVEDLADPGPLTFERRRDVVELGTELGLDLLGPLNLPAGPMHAPELTGEQRDLARDDQPPTALSGLPAARMNSASPDARESCFGVTVVLAVC
jgi:hypothetical protein